MPAPSSPPAVAGVDASNPVIIYNSKNLWLPRKFTKWDLTATRNAAITQGAPYIQVASDPLRYEATGKTANFPNTSAAWVEGEGAVTFVSAWDTFMAWAQVGKVFSFYRSATDAGTRSYFQYCVWTGKDDGLNQVIGNTRYNLEIAFATEGAAR